MKYSAKANIENGQVLCASSCCEGCQLLEMGKCVDVVAEDKQDEFDLLSSQIISPVTIGVVISSFIEGDTTKALVYANFIADKYRDAGEQRAERIIRKRIDGSYKNESVVTLDADNY